MTTKAVERHAEALGAEMVAQEQAALQRGLPVPLPPLAGPTVPVLYVEMDGTGVPVVSAETVGRAGKQTEQARTREVKLGCVFTQTDGGCPRPTEARGGLDHLHGRHRNGGGVWAAHLLRSLSSGLEPRPEESGHRRWRPLDLEPDRRALSGSGSDCGSLSRPPALMGTGGQALAERPRAAAASGPANRKRKLEGGRIESLRAQPALALPRHPRDGRTPAPHGRLFSSSTRHACATRRFGDSICLWAPASSRLAARP